MNKLKRTLALMAALAMTATAFVGCGGNDSSSTSESKAESSAEDSSEADADSAEDSTAEEESSVESAAGYTNVDVPALGEPDGSLKDGGDKLTILCWNDDDLKYMYDIVADATGMDKSMINYKNVDANGTDANEQYAQVFLSGDDVDLYFCDADWNMAYQNNDEYSAPLSAVGISEDMYANAYDYTVAMGKDKNGVLKGASWQAAAGGYAYRADLAEEYLGVTSPEDMLMTYEALAPLGKFMLAATFGNVHGVYKPGHVKLKPSILRDGQEAVVAKHGEAARMPLVFHGGSGSELSDIREAVSYGVVKMNIDTDTQYAFTRPIVSHMCEHINGVLKIDGEVGNKKDYDPRSYLAKGEKGVAARLQEAADNLMSAGKTLFGKI